MKKSKIARKCNPWGGVSIAQLVNGIRMSHPQQVVLELKDVKPEVLTFKASRPIRVNGIGRRMSNISRFVPVTRKFFEVKAVTKKEAKELRRQGFSVQLLGPTSEFDSTTSILKAIRRAANKTGSGKTNLSGRAGRSGRSGGRRSGVAYSSIGGGCGSGFGGGGPSGIGFPFGGGGSSGENGGDSSDGLDE